ncbi:DUF4058 family protein [Candidatus Gracilibacteria bacterium]|nr:DUF4058 family protein [Candidatus Gracilibacteria bacterium]
MPTPFPGMDPYLEHPALWPDIHNSLIAALSDELAPQLRPRYYVAIKERIYTFEPGELVFVGRADNAIVQRFTPSETLAEAQPSDVSDRVIVEVAAADLLRETYVEVRTADTHDLVTVLEILSPTNKRSGEGHAQYLRKRNVILSSLTHLVEIDLVRAGETMPMQRWSGSSDYRTLVSRAEQRPRALLLPFNVRQPIPAFALPLYSGDNEPVVDLNRILHQLYERRSYDLRVNYRTDPEPPLAPGDAAWAAGLLHDADLLGTAKAQRAPPALCASALM